VLVQPLRPANLNLASFEARKQNKGARIVEQFVRLHLIFLYKE